MGGASGAVFEISGAELARADAHEVAAYVRVKAPLASGLEARVDVDARGKPPGKDTGRGRWGAAMARLPPAAPPYRSRPSISLKINAWAILYPTMEVPTPLQANVLF